MILSMTGYGKSSTVTNNKKISVEIKSVNSKFLDLNLRLPIFYREKETAVRSIINQQIVRGKVDFSLHVEIPENKKAQKINKEIVRAYFSDLKDIAETLNLNMDNELFALATKMPDTLSQEKEDLDEKEWEVIETVIKEALNAFIAFREQEGQTLYTDIKFRIDTILSLLNEVDRYENERIETIKSRILKNLETHFKDAQIDNNRLEQEMIYYLEKLDVTEEKVRLKGHCDYFLDVMHNENGQGKKLGFISQEIGREINTLGSKANQQDLQKIVVQMKDELEKLKEQLLNID